MRRSWCLVQLSDDGQTMRLSSSYDPRLVEALKRLIPAADRRWDEAAQVWVIQGAAYEAVCLRLAKTFRSAEAQQGAITKNLHSGRTHEQLQLF